MAKRGGRPSKYETEWKDKLAVIQGWARDGLVDEQIAKNMGISTSTLYEWKNKYLEFAEALKKGKEVVDREVENALLKRALGYSYQEVTKERIIDTGQKKRHGGESELTEEEWEFAKKYFNFRCCYCGAMTEDLTKDHVKPLKKDGKLTFDNVVPACRSCNSKKKDKEIMSWYQSMEFYDVHRMEKIYDYLNFVISLGGKLRHKNDENGEMIVTKIVTKEVLPDVTAQIFWLKNRKPDKWRDKQDIDIKGDMEVNNPFKGLTTEELKKLVHDD